MTVTLKGHDYKYAVEQMLLTLFPDERPTYGTEEENRVTVSLRRGDTWLTATAVLYWKGRLTRHSCRARVTELTGDELSDGRVGQRIVKLAFYRAGVEALGKEPPWGAMTGVRPVKIPTKDLLAGATPAQAADRLRRVYRVSPLRADLAVACAQASVMVKNSLRPEEISLYVGIPFCPTRCAYCSFISADVKHALKLMDPYVDALVREITAAGTALKREGLSVKSVYFGGGTPTTLSADQLERVLSALEEHVDLSHSAEYTVEAGRPDTITREKLEVLARHGVDRVSVNPQTMEDTVLRAMGRAHTAQQIGEAYALVRESGAFLVNMDLIAGLPADTPEGFRRTLDKVLALSPENITVHTLALKRGSTLTTGGFAAPLPGAEQVAEMLDYAWCRLARAGYEPYYLYRQKFMSGSFENVGWCAPGCESVYNICMMEELQSILSLGAGGVTKLVDTQAGRIERRANPKYPQDYLERIDQICREKEELPWPISCRRSTGASGKT
ncbi:MAG: coproporphyrinogen dehydrogenase HemZ [Oscillospiraceae bacterium]